MRQATDRDWAVIELLMSTASVLYVTVLVGLGGLGKFSVKSLFAP